jgi:hypothetical protein
MHHGAAVNVIDLAIDPPAIVRQQHGNHPGDVFHLPHPCAGDAGELDGEALRG